ncbi:MAG TPA: ABC transporter permease [Cyclobacteriaceae bacterium]|nr:ABC transporter permease [Cyclobacteriaceae bacterium]
MKNLPPQLLVNFFRWYCHPKLVNHIEGDLIEVYRKRVAKSSKRRADFRFFIDILVLFRPGIIRSFRSKNLNRYGMFKNYFKMTFRVFNRERLYSVINVSGLAVGFSCCLLIYLFIADELSYDKFHVNGDRIYRLSAAYMRQGQWEPYASNAWKTAELVKTNYSEVELLTRISPDGNTLFEYQDKRIVENSFAWVDDTFFSMFNFPLIQGNPAEALKGPNKVVISKSTAAKYFGTDDAIGKVLRLSDYPIDVQVSGVMNDMPTNSHFHFDLLISGETLRQVTDPGLFTNVGWDSQYVYIRLNTGSDAARMEATFPDFVNKNLDFWKSTTFKLFLQPLESIHLQSAIGNELEANGSLSRIYTFTVIAIFVLVIACVNYMNLTTARSLRRAKEVGMRKVIGAKKGDLLGQFLLESFVMTTIATLLAVLICLVLLPVFNEFAGKQIPRNILLSPQVLTGLLVSLLAIALVSGLYPALMLSSFKPLNSMKMSAGTGGKTNLLFRKGLVLLQFMISIGLIAASAIVYNQWNFMKNKDLGINDDAILVVPLQTMDRAKINTFTSELLTEPSIARAGYTNMRLPGWIGNSTDYRAQDVNPDDEVNKSMKIVRIDYDFLSTVEAQIVEGRNFSRDFPADTISSIILNESAVEQLRWKEGAGKWMEFRNQRFNVVGVVKDFHFESLHRKIPPTIFIFSPRAFNFAYVKVGNNNVQSSLSHIEKVYSKYVTNRDFSFTFLDEDIQKQYAAEQKFSEVFAVFTGLAILIACLGTFGLISFSAERKSKEIGIRKVLGASVGNVSFLLVREFVILLMVASVIAWPFTWYFLNNWVQSFTYRTSIGVMPFIIATVLAAFIVILTTGFRALKAGLANPVQSLRE